MRVIIFWIIALMVLPLVSYAQVDTLMLVEIGSIQASSEIRELYVEDLDGDSLKEIILCTDYFVYIYDSQSYQVEWTSPSLLAPTDLLFEDINGDGLIDFSVKDSTNIHLFDPHTPQTIWTSPPLDSTYKCYTIGDRNDDDWVDVAIVNQLPTNDIVDDDTAWVNINDGPSFNLNNSYYIILQNYNSWWSGGIQIPTSILIGEISENDILSTKIFIFILSSNWSNSTNGGLHNDNGFISIADGISLDNNYILSNTGNQFYYALENISGNTRLYMFGNYGRSMWGWQDFIETWKNLNIFSNDSLLYTRQIWYRWDAPGVPYVSEWRGYIINDIDLNNVGKELCIGIDSTLVLINYPEWSNLNWAYVSELANVKATYTNYSTFEFPQIICEIGDPTDDYYFLSGNDLSLTAVLHDNGYFELSEIVDLNADDNDEILSIQGSTLYIYDLDYATGIGDDARLPKSAFLRTNYPNPFNSSTTIEYGLPEAGHVRIEIYDLLGRRVETLVNEEMQAGRHQVAWEADRYASGLYFYRIEAGDYSDTKRMVLLR